jgi:hypothetical protein
MQEQLVGYLLGALDEQEHREVEQLVAHDPHWAAACARLERTLLPLAEDDEQFAPPPRLATLTVAFVAAQAEKASLQQEITYQAKLVDGQPQVERPTPASLSNSFYEANSRSARFSLADVIVAACICAAAAVLFVPAIANSRQQAAILSCQNNLRQLSTALVGYSRRNYGQFPFVPLGSKLGVSGVYAPVLKEAGLVEDDKVFVCAGSPLAGQNFSVPTKAEVLAAEDQQLSTLQRKLGGSYGYAFGYVDDRGEYQPNIDRSRPRFALLADAPSLHLANRQSANHGGRGQNVLFEDGHVDYLTNCRMSDCTDDVFHSDRGYVEAGRHFGDSVIGHSADRPVISRIAAH